MSLNNGENGAVTLSKSVRKLSVKKPENRAELALILMKAAMYFPGGLDVFVSLNFVRAVTALSLPVPNISAAKTAAGAALAACMQGGILNDRPETGVVYSVAHLLAHENPLGGA